MPMKKFLFLFFIILITGTAGAQHLRISSISGIPLFPGDTVFEASQYSVSVIVVNDDSVAFDLSDTIDILITNNDSLFTTDTIATYSDTTSLFPGDSVTISNSLYVFEAPHFDDGDNIVVVWPQARISGGTYDSLSFEIYYVSLGSGIDEQEVSGLIVYPNPSTDYLFLGNSHKFKIKQVRILDLSGKEIYLDKTQNLVIPISNLKAGQYLLEVQNTGGRKKVFTIQKK
jgi:hypothetical protein